jgi:D-sedoheptulose 7-phosphate isomerase
MSSHRTLIDARIADHSAMIALLRESDAYLSAVSSAADAMIAALRKGRKILFFGNGGSAADAQHLAAELTGRFLRERNSLPGLALSTNSSSITAIGNDYGFDEVFSRPLAGLGEAGDVVFGLSTSGNSPNVLRAMQVAKEKQIVTIGLSGRGGKLPGFVDHAICIPCDATPRIQEAHILTGHILCELIEGEMC